MRSIQAEVEDVLQKGYVEPHKSLKLKAIFDKYREENKPRWRPNETNYKEKKNG